MHKTMTDLHKFRKQTEISDINQKKADRDLKLAFLKNQQHQHYHRPQEYVEKPKYTATWQRYRDDRREKRQAAGLTEENVDTNPKKLVDPSLKWVDKTQLNLNERRKAMMLNELKCFEKNYESHINGQERIENREDCILRLTFKGVETESKNMRQIKGNRVREMIDDMTQKFGEQVLGVHG